MKFAEFSKHKYFRPIVGAVLAVLCGVALWGMPAGEPWVYGSYDNLFRFGTRHVTNKVVLIQMDNAAYDQLGQIRAKPWDRGKHAEVLNRLAKDGCAMVIFDCFFRGPGEPEKDAALVASMRRQHRVVLMAQQAKQDNPNFVGVNPVRPDKMFLEAAGETNWGVAWLNTEPDLIVRKHWPPTSPDRYPSLPWRAAELCDASLDDIPQERWLRYYRPERAWVSFGYHYALTQPANFYRDAIVFIGNKPSSTLPDGEDDKFRIPSTVGPYEAVGGMEILATEYLNLMNNEWMRRPAGWVELLSLIGTGIVFGCGLCFGRQWVSLSIAAAAFLIIALGAVLFSYYTNYWYPWLVISGGQIPCALVWAITSRRAQPVAAVVPAPAAGRKKTVMLSPDLFEEVSDYPEAPDYEFFGAAFGEGAFGKVWVVRNSVGEHQALKAVYASKFGKNAKPYEMEFKGIKRFKPISGDNPGLLRVDFVSKQKAEGYFYYVMELGDALAPGWEQAPATYRPRDLYSAALQNPDHRLTPAECVDIGASLADALGFLHGRGFVHRDIKPTNIIFVKGRPKLADVGLVTDIRPENEVTSFAGTEHYMPPAPEPPGTPQADIYALGKVLYVISTGNHPRQFPELPAALLADTVYATRFMRLNPILLKACAPDRDQRYASAAEMHSALKEVQTEWSVKGGTEPR